MHQDLVKAGSRSRSCGAVDHVEVEVHRLAGVGDGARVAAGELGLDLVGVGVRVARLVSDLKVNGDVHGQVGREQPRAVDGDAVTGERPLRGKVDQPAGGGEA